MNTKRPARPNPGNFTIPLLMLAALGAVAFICASTFIFYKNIDRLLAFRSLNERSQKTSQMLQATAQNLERMDYITRLYLANKSPDDLKTAQLTAGQINTRLKQVEEMVKDNPIQLPRAQSADHCAQELKQDVGQLIAQNASGDQPQLTRKMLECRDIINQMEVQEASRLQELAENSASSTYRNRIAGAGFVVASLAIVVILFAYLLHNARRKIETEKELSDTNERLNESVEALEERAAESAAVTGLREELQLCATLAQAHRAIVRHVSQLLPTAKIALLVANHAREILEITATSDSEVHILDGVPLDACCGLRSGHPRRRRPAQSETDCEHFIGTPPEHYICLPLAGHGQTLGLLYVGCAAACDATELDIHQRVLERLVELSSMFIASLRLRTLLEEQSIRDGLTDLFNRRFMEITLERELRLAERHENELSLLMIDIDHFKKFNDAFGHEAGDQVLRATAKVLQDSVRVVDIICRYGGEEFLVILPGMDTANATERAEYIRKRMSKMYLDFQGRTLKNVTVSIGISTYPKSGRRIDALVGAADRALYAAKDHGRNRVQAADSTITL